MRTARLKNRNASVSVATTRCHSAGVGGIQMNKSKPVSNGHYQMSLQGGGGPQVGCPWGSGGMLPRSDV